MATIKFSTNKRKAVIESQDPPAKSMKEPDTMWAIYQPDCEKAISR